MPVILLMGVSGSGKTTVGQLLALELDIRFVDGDDLHPRANVEKMATGTPLGDRDRESWLGAIRREIEMAVSSGNGLVVACSALKRAYRRRLVEPGEPVRVVHLAGSRELIASRMRSRSGHFMPLDLLDSQFRDLEAPQDAIELDIGFAPDDLVNKVLEVLRSE